MSFSKEAFHISFAPSALMHCFETKVRVVYLLEMLHSNVHCWIAIHYCKVKKSLYCALLLMLKFFQSYFEDFSNVSPVNLSHSSLTPSFILIKFSETIGVLAPPSTSISFTIHLIHSVLNFLLEFMTVGKSVPIVFLIDCSFSIVVNDSLHFLSVLLSMFSGTMSHRLTSCSALSLQ